jgi:hypothetical protein
MARGAGPNGTDSEWIAAAGSTKMGATRSVPFTLIGGLLVAVFGLAGCVAERSSSMSELPTPADLHSLVVRTDFADEPAWQSLRRELTAPTGLFRANLQFIDDRRYENLTLERLLALEDGSNQTFVFLADRDAMTRADHAVLVVDLFEDGRGRTFRVVPAAIWAVQNNLVIGNSDWEDFADSLDADGVFRNSSR